MIRSIQRYVGVFPVYNIEVDGLHTYLVSELGVLVHNKAMRAGPQLAGTGTQRTALDPSTGELLGVGELKDGYVEFAIYTKEAKSSIRGGEVFQSILDDFVDEGAAVKGVRGLWYKGDNLDSFNNAIRRGLAPEQAAAETFTGKLAGRNGFKQVRIDYARSPRNIDGTFQKAELWFE